MDPCEHATGNGLCTSTQTMWTPGGCPSLASTLHCTVQHPTPTAHLLESGVVQPRTGGAHPAVQVAQQRVGAAAGQGGHCRAGNASTSCTGSAGGRVLQTASSTSASNLPLAISRCRKTFPRASHVGALGCVVHPALRQVLEHPADTKPHVQRVRPWEMSSHTREALRVAALASGSWLPAHTTD